MNPLDPAEAELSLLACIFQQPRWLDVLDVTETDFYQPRHGELWNRLAELHRDDSKPDPVNVGPHLSTLFIEIATNVLAVAGNAEHYAGVVKDASVRRSTLNALDGLRARLNDLSIPLDQALAEVERALTKGADLEAAAAKLETLDEFLDRPRPPQRWVIPELLTVGDRLVLTGAEGFGKALALDTPIPTPEGWTTMGELRTGDRVLGADGRPARVVHAMAVQTGRPCYRVTFSDGSSIVADERHEWLTETLLAREAAAKYAAKPEGLRPRGTNQRHKRVHFPTIVETGEIQDTLHARDGHSLNHSVVTCQPLDLPEVDLPIAPYVVGAWLGDGTSRGSGFTCADQGIIDRIRKDESCRKLSTRYHWAIGERGFTRRLRDLNLIQNKHIPPAYLRASLSQRLELLRGLMDTDGTIGTNHQCEFTVCRERLAKDVYELLMTMGIKATMKASPAVLRGVEVGTRWRISFQTPLQVFALERKAERIRSVSRRAMLRYITSVEPVDSVPVRCIEVDSEDHLFLAGESFVPTHNSVCMRQIGVMAACGLHPFALRNIPPQKVLLVDCENPEEIMADVLGTLRDVAHRRSVDAGDRFWLIRYPQGLDLSKPKDRLELHRQCMLIRPDLLLIGPAYKLYVGGGNQREEDLARQVTSALDGLREEFGFALILEHHSPHASGTGERVVRPIGSSLWLRWPEFGLGLAPNGETEEERARSFRDRKAVLRPWRGARADRPWPKFLHASKEAGALPWADPHALHHR